MRFSELAADPGAIPTVIEHLESGGLLVHPTSGVYGIGGGADAAIDAEVARLKARPEGPGLIRLVADVEAAVREFPGARWSPVARRLASEFWPGPLTLVLEDGSEHGIALRAESHAFTRALLVAWGRSLGSSSLNVSGGPPASSAAGAREVLAGMPGSERPVTFVNAGPLPGPPPSTLVRVTGGAEGFEVLRPGAIPLGRLAEVAGDAAGTGARREGS